LVFQSCIGAFLAIIIYKLFAKDKGYNRFLSNEKENNTKIRLLMYLEAIGVSAVFCARLIYFSDEIVSLNSNVLGGIVALIASFSLLAASIEDIMFREVEYEFTIPFALLGTIISLLRGPYNAIISFTFVFILLLIPEIVIRVKKMPLDTCALGGADGLLIIGIFGFFDLFECCEILIISCLLAFAVKFSEKDRPLAQRLLMGDVDEYGTPIENGDITEQGVALVPILLFSISIVSLLEIFVHSLF